MFEEVDLASVDLALDALPMIQAGLLERQVIGLGPWLPLEIIFDRALAGIA
jgi:hypothetical protein